MAGVELDAVGQLEQPLEAAEEAVRALDGLGRESGRACESIKSESPVITDGLVARDETSSSAQPVARVWRDPGRHLAHPDLLAVGERLERIIGLGLGVDVHRHAVLECEPPVSGDVVGVRVRLEDSASSRTPRSRPASEVLLDRVPCRVDRPSLAR